MLVVDAANVVGSRPTGWWRDRAGAAQTLHQALTAAVESGRLTPPVVVVLEGAARGGVPEGVRDGLRVTHAGHGGDDAIVEQAEHGVAAGQAVTVVTADRGLRDRVERLGASVVGPRWLLDQLDQPEE